VVDYIQMEPSAATAQRRLEALTKRSPIGLFETDAEGRLSYINDRLAAMAGLAVDDSGHTDILQAIHPDDRDAVSAAWARAVAEGEDFEASYRYQRPDGGICWAIGHATPVYDDEGRNVAGFLGVVQDVTELRLREAELLEAEERFRLAFELAPIGKALVSPNGVWVRVNRQVCAMTGYEQKQLLGSTSREITHPDDREVDSVQSKALLAGDIDGYEFQKRYIRADGTTIWALVSVSLVRDETGAPLYFVCQMQDITDRKREVRELRHLADHDPLTGLSNRRRFGDDLARELARSERNGNEAALLVLDIDDFKGINDALGHRAGDELLRRIATALRRRLRKTDLIGRLGGDEFAVLLLDSDRKAARRVAEDLLTGIRAESAGFAGDIVKPSASIGIVMSGDLAGSDLALLAAADMAMYTAKHAGRNRVSELDASAARAS
jgi:diguanylate cyclase (GGDEF)-like protein/PAS domain S-box-containing protein